jgi:hypothetical protein
MTYPGFGGQVGPPPSSTTGWQVRQSVAGRHPGGFGYATVIDAMGASAPASAKTAEANTVLEEVADNPHPIEAENFELNVDQNPDIGSTSYSGQGGS